MGSKKSGELFAKIIVGVAVAVISTLIIANLGLSHEGNQSSPVNRTTQYQSPAPQVELGSWCCDAWGIRRCQLMNPINVGSPCFCLGQGNGQVCD